MEDNVKPIEEPPQQPQQQEEDTAQQKIDKNQKILEYAIKKHNVDKILILLEAVREDIMTNYDNVNDIYFSDDIRHRMLSLSKRIENTMNKPYLLS
jgi:glycyl-tRNA synthetase beta subunit